MNNGREKLPWSQDIWDRIDRAVHDEGKRTKIAARFLCPPVMVEATTLTVPSDTIRVTTSVLDVDEGQTTQLMEIQVLFSLTRQQVDKEAQLMTAVTLATRAANLLAQGEDLLIFQGDAARAAHSLFQGVAAAKGVAAEPRKVQVKSGIAGKGLLNLPDSGNPGMQVIQVAQSGPGRWGENTFGEVQKAYARLQGGQGLSQAHYGPYALVLNHVPYADTFAPLANTLIMPADRIRPLVTNMSDGKVNFYGTGTLPPSRAIFVSVGGNTLDLVMAQDATTAFVQEDIEGNYLFRVFERFAVREKDVTSVVRLEFQ